jgi:hypothetical protein
MSNSDVKELADSIATAARSVTSAWLSLGVPVINMRWLLTLGVRRNHTGWALA